MVSNGSGDGDDDNKTTEENKVICITMSLVRFSGYNKVISKTTTNT